MKAVLFTQVQTKCLGADAIEKVFKLYKRQALTASKFNEHC